MEERGKGGKARERDLPNCFQLACSRLTGVDKGGPGGPDPPIFLVKIEGLSSLPPAKSGRACHDNPTGRGYFYQMPNVYTCIAYLIEIRKFCSKTWFIKVLILRPKML